MKAIKELKKQNGIAATRLRLGLSQQAMALELGISNGTLSRVESGERSMPAAALAKLSALEIKLAARTIVAAKQLPEAHSWSRSERASLIKNAITRGARCRQRAEKCQEMLDNMKARYNKISRSIRDVEGLIADAGTGTEPGPLNIKGLQLHRDQLVSKLADCGHVSQTELRHKIALLYAEAQLHAVDADSYQQE